MHSQRDSSFPDQKRTIFVAGIEGFVEKHLTLHLLRLGFNVRASTDSIHPQDALRTIVEAGIASQGSLVLVPAGSHLASSWKHALGNSQYAVQVAPQVASVHASSQKTDPDRLAVCEALGQAARRRGIKCIDIEASHAVEQAPDRDKKQRVRRQGNPTRLLLEPTSATPHLRLQVPCVMGPLIDQRIPHAMDVLEHLLAGKVSRIPNIEYEIIDVRDLVAWLGGHFETSDIPQGRVVLRGSSIRLKDIVAVLRRRFPQVAEILPNQEISNLGVWTHAAINPQARGIVSSLGKTHSHACGESDALDATPGSHEVTRTLIDAARSILLMGNLKMQPALSVDRSPACLTFQAPRR